MLPEALPANRQPAAWPLGHSPPADWDPMFPSPDTDLRPAQTDREVSLVTGDESVLQDIFRQKTVPKAKLKTSKCPVKPETSVIRAV